MVCLGPSEAKSLRQPAEFAQDTLDTMKQVSKVIEGYKPNFDNFRPIPSDGLNFRGLGRRSGRP